MLVLNKIPHGDCTGVMQEIARKRIAAIPTRLDGYRGYKLEKGAE